MKLSFVALGFEKFAIKEANPVVKQSIDVIKNIDAKAHIIEDIVFTNEGYQQLKTELVSQRPDVLIIQFATFCMGSEVLKLLEGLKDTQVIFWGIREPKPASACIKFNSFTALNMISSFMHKWQRPFISLFGNPTEEELQKDLTAAIMANKVKYALSVAKFCVIGAHPPGFYLSDLDEMRLRAQYGCEIIHLSELTLLQKIEEMDDSEALPLIEEMKKEATIKANEKTVLLAAKFQKALENLAEEEQISGFAIKCWPDLQIAKNFAPCSVISRLNNRGLICSCEADIPALISMFMMKFFTDKPVFLTDLVNITEEGALELWHCGPAPIALAAPSCKPEYGEHPTIKDGIGLSANFPLMGGEAALLKFKETQTGYRLFFADGKAVEPKLPMCGSHVLFAPIADSKAITNCIFDNGIEHHYCLAYGADISRSVKMLAKIANMQLLHCG